MSRLFSSACSGDMYSSVPTIWPTSVNIVRSVSFCAVALATPKSMTFGTGLPSYSAISTFDGFRIAMDDAFLVGMLHGLADRNEQLQPFFRRQVFLVAIL